MWPLEVKISVGLSEKATEIEQMIKSGFFKNPVASTHVPSKVF